MASRKEQKLARKEAILKKRHDEGCSLIYFGQWVEGFQLVHEYNAYHRRPGIKTTVPEWTGQDLADKSVLVVHEQGLGDTIMMARYIPFLRAMGATVHVWAPLCLCPLLKTVRGVGPVVAGPNPNEEASPHIPLPITDYWIGTMALPYRFASTPETVPRVVPYFHPDQSLADRVRGVLGDSTINVGVFWQGGPAHLRDLERSFRLDMLAPIAAIPRVRMVSLQVGKGIEQIADAPFPILNLGQAFTNFAQTAAAIDALDLVISCDTATANLAGALGKETWIALPVSTDWRWPLRPDNPWYPTVRLFRQAHDGEWTPVFNAMADLLRRSIV